MHLGDSGALREVERAMSDHYTIKVRAVLGAECDDAKEVRILNRYVRWNSKGGQNWIEYEPDPRHAELTIKSLKLESAKGVTTPSVKKKLEDVLEISAQLDALQTRQYRSVVMRAAYLSQDRPDLTYSSKELARLNAEADRTIDDQFEASRSVFEKTSKTCTVVRRKDIRRKTLFDYRRIW